MSASINKFNLKLKRVMIVKNVCATMLIAITCMAGACAQQESKKLPPVSQQQTDNAEAELNSALQTLSEAHQILLIRVANLHRTSEATKAKVATQKQSFDDAFNALSAALTQQMNARKALEAHPANGDAAVLDKLKADLKSATEQIAAKQELYDEQARQFSKLIELVITERRQ